MFEYKTPLPSGGGDFVCGLVFRICLSAGRKYPVSAGVPRPGPLVPRSGIDHRHPRALGRTHRGGGGIETLETEHVDAEMIRRGALAVKRVDAAA